MYDKLNPRIVAIGLGLVDHETILQIMNISPSSLMTLVE